MENLPSGVRGRASHSIQPTHSHSAVGRGRLRVEEVVVLQFFVTMFSQSPESLQLASPIVGGNLTGLPQ